MMGYIFPPFFLLAACKALGAIKSDGIYFFPIFFLGSFKRVVKAH